MNDVAALALTVLVFATLAALAWGLDRLLAGKDDE